MASVTAAMSASESSSSEVLVLSMVSASSLSNSCSPSIEKHKNYYKKGPLSGLREVPLQGGSPKGGFPQGGPQKVRCS